MSNLFMTGKQGSCKSGRLESGVEMHSDTSATRRRCRRHDCNRHRILAHLTVNADIRRPYAACVSFTGESEKLELPAGLSL